MPITFSCGYISELVCTRLSHDLIGNIGAVANAVELMDDDPDCLADVKPILEISSSTLSARLKFFRLAFGLSNAAVKTISEIENAAQNYINTIGSRNTPIKLVFSIKTPELYKVILLGIMVMGDIFVRGGTLEISEELDGLSFNAISPFPLSGAKLTALQNVLEGRMPEENPAQFAAVAYLQKHLEKSAVKIAIEYKDNQARLTIG